MNDAANKAAANYRVKNNITTASKSSEYKTKVMRRQPANNNRLNTEVAVPLKYFNNFWRSLDSLLIKCEIEIDLSWSKKFVISEILRTIQWMQHQKRVERFR